MTNEQLYANGWMEKVQQMPTEELTKKLSKEYEYNHQYIEIVKQELLKRGFTACEFEKISEKIEVEETSNTIPTVLIIMNVLLVIMGIVGLIQLDVFSFALCIYSVRLLTKRRGNAIFVTVGFLSVTLASYMLVLLLTDSMAMSIFLFIPIIFRGYFIYYLTQSEDMELFIPQEERYYKIRDIVLLGAYIFWIIILISNA